MKNILIQHSQSTLYDRVLSIIDGVYLPIVANDETLGEALAKHKNNIAAIVIFELSEASLKLSRIARNERFSDPTIPIAYVGNESSTFAMPYGATRFDERDVDILLDFLSTQLKIRALIVEDDEALREITSLTLNKYMEVESASNGADGYKLINEKYYDLVILDVMLPGMSGEELFAHVVGKSSATAVIVVTAFDTDDREFNFTFNGAAAYIKKPFESNKIFRCQVMEAMLQHHEVSEQSRLSISRETRDAAIKSYEHVMSRYL